MDYNKLYIIALGITLYALYYAYKKNSKTYYTKQTYLCQNCNTKLEEIQEEENGFKYVCKKCKFENTVNKLEEIIEKKDNK